MSISLLIRTAICATAIGACGCTYQNSYFQQHALPTGPDAQAIDALVAASKFEFDPAQVRIARAGYVEVGMPENLVRAACGELLARKGLAQKRSDNLPVASGGERVTGAFRRATDGRAMYLYFAEGQLAAIVVIGWRPSDPL